MQPIEIARRMAELGRTEDAQKAYLLALQEEGHTAAERFEAASYLFFSEGDYKVAYTTFVTLYNEGAFREKLMDLMTQAFYLPNVNDLRQRYEKNCHALARYPYFFRSDFPDFDSLTVRFFPFDDNGFLPYDPREDRFSPYINFRNPVIDRYFFKDLENPILAEDVYSQYQLEYLNDTVRKSEWVGRENHIYLHYTNWEQFCAYLQCLDFKRLLEDEKFVFLIGSEIERYPIDFLQTYGIDYSRYPVRPLGIREIHRLIWHTQLATHNGGDFFNEIFYGHPNLLSFESVMMEQIVDYISKIKNQFHNHTLKTDHPEIYRQLLAIKHPTDKDFLVALFLARPEINRFLDRNSRIAPAIFFQPHFPNIIYRIEATKRKGYYTMYSQEYEAVKSSPIFRGFKYIKTFTPIRRITTSYGATIRFMAAQMNEEEPKRMSDVAAQRLLNQSFLIDPQDRLFKDSVLVRFEDGKINPKATFMALAEFVDIPYTESMTYCTTRRGINVAAGEGADAGFDLAPVYRTYDDYCDDADRAVLEYFLRRAYAAYGYEFHYYHGETVDTKWLQEKLNGFHHLDTLMSSAMARIVWETAGDKDAVEKSVNTEKYMEEIHKHRMLIMELLLTDPCFISRNDQPLKMMKPLKLDPALLEQPLYR